jgi:hypothetical protein
VVPIVNVNPSGRFDVALAPGQYVIQAEPDNGLDGVAVPVMVRPDRVTFIRVTFNPETG